MKPVKSTRFWLYLLVIFIFCVLILFATIVHFANLALVKPACQNELFSLLISDSSDCGRLSAVDQQLKDMSSLYVEQPFIHPFVPVGVRKSSKHVPSRPKMHSVLEIRTVILPERVKVSQPCGGKKGQGLLAAVFVFCQIKDFSRRQAIRETYGSELKAHPQTVMYFVVSRVNNVLLENALIKEASQHDDILQFDFKDDYFNLTLKSLAVLRWSALHCSKAKFIFKFDYDCYIRVDNFINQVKSFSPDKLYGFKKFYSKVQRTGKWAIDRWYYPYKFYPAYAPSMYLIPGNATLAMYETVTSSPTTDTIPALPIEDAYITGILAKKLCFPLAIYPNLNQKYKNDQRSFAYRTKTIVVSGTNKDVDFRKTHNSGG
ncbi:Beta-1,3-galactosyltransferase 1, partial [Tyrophagus putrescentiae]